MKVAIIGAGIAGLSCAYELEKYNVYATLFEKNGYIGEPYQNVGAILEIYHRPIKDSVKYFRENLGIDIKPLNTLNKLIHYSPNKSTEIEGHLGYFFKRNREPDDIKNQIFSKLKHTQVVLHEYADYASLSKEYDYVIIANGGIDYTDELGCWKEWLSTYIRGATVTGNFDPNAFIVWVNKKYCKKGYAYLTPFNDKKAAIAVVVNDTNEREVEAYWEEFVIAENISYEIIEEFKLCHRSGHIYPHKIGNLILAGNAAGALDPLFGFGIMNSIETGVMAARSITEGKDYEKLIRRIVKRNLQLYEYRKTLNSIDNSGYDRMISSLGLPGIKHIMYHSPLNVVKYGSYILKITNRNK